MIELHRWVRGYPISPETNTPDTSKPRGLRCGGKVGGLNWELFVNDTIHSMRFFPDGGGMMDSWYFRKRDIPQHPEELDWKRVSGWVRHLSLQTKFRKAGCIYQ